MPEWVSYESADEPAAEVSVDVDFDDDREFKQTHPYAAVVTVGGFASGIDGQPDDSVADALFEIESDVEAALHATAAAFTVTVTEGGRFTLYGYVEDPSQIELVRSVTHPAVTLDVRSERDDAWRFYDRYVLRGEELERARDVEQLEQLHEVGAPLDEPIDVSFYIEFASSDALRDALPDLDAAGYAVPEISAEYFADEGLTVVREMVLTVENLIRERTNLTTITAPHGGHYDGWSVDEDIIEEPV